MSQVSAKLISQWFNETLSTMAEHILGFFYTSETRETLDVLNMLFVGWILLGILVYFLGTFIASQIERARRNTIEDVKKSSEALISSDSPAIEEKIESSARPKQLGTTPGSLIPGSSGTFAAQEGLCFGSDFLGAPRTGPLEHVPLANGTDTSSVRWVNHILVWLYTTNKIPLLTDCLLHSLNDQTIKLSAEHGILVEFEKLTLVGDTQPLLSDVYASPVSSNNVTVTCRVLAKHLLFNLLATRNSGSERSSADYELYIERVDSKMKITCNTEDRLLVVRFIERPDLKLTLKLAAGSLKSTSLDQRALEDTIVEIVIQAMASTLVDLHFSQDPDFPRFVKQKESALTPTNYAGMVDVSPTIARHEQRLFVKIIKASNLGGENACQEPYCVVEMDEPPQRFKTSGLKATNSPFWDEHFLFNMTKASSEILFEIYDKGKRTGENFLGLGIVSVEELLKNPSQRQIIVLQSRPMENDKVTGSLTVEFLFMEGSEIPIRQQTTRNVETNSRVTPAGALVTTTTIKKSENETSNCTPKPSIACSLVSKPNSYYPTFPATNPFAKASKLTRAAVSESSFKTCPIKPLLGVRFCEHPLAQSRQSEPLLSKIPLTSKPSLDIPVIRPRSENVTLLRKKYSPPMVIGALIKSKLGGEEVNGFSRDRSWSLEGVSGSQTYVSVPTIEMYSSPNSDMIIERAKSIRRPKNQPPPVPSDEITCITFPDDEVFSDKFEVVTVTNEPSCDPVLGIKDFVVKEMFKDTLFESLPREFPNSTDSNSHISIASWVPSSSYEDHNGNKLPFSDVKDSLTVPIEELPNSPPPKLSSTDPLPSPPLSESSNAPPSLVVTDALNESVDVVPSELTNTFELPQLEVEDQHESIPQIKKLHGKNWLMSKIKGKKKNKGHDLKEDENFLKETALKELEHMGKPGMSTNKSTLIIHSVQRTNGENVSGSGSPSSPTSKGVPSIANSESDNENRSARSKDRKSFMGTLRKRLSFKKNRSKSVDQKGVEAAGQTSNDSSRSVSADRSKSVPGSRETSAGRHGRLDVPGGGSTRSSLSEGSGFSGTSTRTYINENSTLVVEINENGITKHYLIPFSLASRSKWRKRGVKLHIYNDHTFVAKHISGAIDCQVCTRRFPRRPGKQAYACRDCDLQCHKTCHVKVDSRCPSSTIHTLEMEYVQDPRAKSKS